MIIYLSILAKLEGFAICISAAAILADASLMTSLTCEKLKKVEHFRLVMGIFELMVGIRF